MAAHDSKPASVMHGLWLLRLDEQESVDRACKGTCKKETSPTQALRALLLPSLYAIVWA